MKKALITGITGQDGSYLAELLLGKGYEVHGTSRSLVGDKEKFWRIEHLFGKISIHNDDISNRTALSNLLIKISPDEIYHLAGQKQSKDFDQDFATFSINVDTTRYMLEFIKGTKPECKLFFAGSSEMFGHSKTISQSEESPFNPISPYAISKVAGYFISKIYREADGIFACTGILFNHESPRRRLNVVTRKITNTAVKIKKGLENELTIGNLSARRDWGFSGDFVEAMWMMLQLPKPEDFVLGTGEVHSVQDFIEKTFTILELDWKQYVKEDAGQARALDVQVLSADISKAKKVLGWQPKTSFDGLVEMMTDADLRLKAGNK